MNADMDNSGTEFDVRAYNRKAWNRQVAIGNQWTIPVSPEVIRLARQGNWELLLTPQIPVPRDWYPHPLAGKDVLCLASGGGQQGPVLAAAGANVTVLDNSPAQLDRDRLVAEREKLSIRTLEGEMRDLSIFENESFDLIFHPVSNVFVPQIQPVWDECYRVLRKGGILLAGFVNPAVYIFDLASEEKEGLLKVRHSIPYSDLTSLTSAELKDQMDKGEPLEFAHSLDAQIGGQLKAGFILNGFFEDTASDMLLSKYMPTMIATRAQKL